MSTAHSTKGTLTVIAGPMFSGKTGKLVAMIDVFGKMGFGVFTLKPALDARYSAKAELHSHDHQTRDARIVDGETAEDITRTIISHAPQKVIVDEVQFFEKLTILHVISALRKSGVDVIAAGLLYDYRRKPFGATAELLGLADESLELLSICQKCGSLARHSERVAGDSHQIDIGAADKYIAVCQACHVIYEG